MVEMLLTAFIMAVGLMGLTMLQAMTFRGQASSGNQAVAVQLANQVLDRAAMIGRNSLDCARNGIAPPVVVPNFFNGNTPVVLIFSHDGERVPPGVQPAFFTATSTALTAAGAGAAGVVNPVKGLGGIAQLTVVVQWTDTTAANGTPVNRSVTIQRQINYATS
jgi:Tfp pilus assembly protein PilV